VLINVAVTKVRAPPFNYTAACGACWGRGAFGKYCICMAFTSILACKSVQTNLGLGAPPKKKSNSTNLKLPPTISHHAYITLSQSVAGLK